MQTPDHVSIAVFVCAGKAKKSGERGMLPVTIKQIMGAQEEGDENAYKIDGRECTQVSIVGQIINLHEQSVNHTYTIEDSTGQIDAIMWIDQDESDYQQQLRSTWTPGAYVRVVGNVRSNPQTNAKNINAFHMRRITDFNEITYHLLDSIHSHLYNTQGPKGSAPPGGSTNFASPGKPSMGPGGGAAGGPAGGAGAAVAAYSAPAGGAGAMDLSACVIQAFDQITDTGGGGVSVMDIVQYCASQMGREISKAAVSQVCDKLSMEGHIYSTVDEEHFAKI